MRFGLVGAIGVVAFVAVLPAQRALAAVNLALRPDSQIVPIGTSVDIGLYAVSDDGTEQYISALEVVLTWDPTALELVGATNNGPHSWTMSGFLADSELDGLNDSLLDGDAWYQALSLTPATATDTGLLVTTLTFVALAETEAADVVIQPSLGTHSASRVFEWGQVNYEITGTLGSASVTVTAQPTLSAADVVLPAGRKAEVVVSGTIVGLETFGVTVGVELVPRAGTVGTLTFTPAPPVDILELEDPWPGTGGFNAFDTDLAESVLLNGGVYDNGTFVPAPVTFSGPLAAFPITAGMDTRGVWDATLATLPSYWENLDATLVDATITVVALGDGDDSRTIDLRDFSELQACFTGPVGPIEPPAYAFRPGLWCNVYDFDDDGDIDAFDYAAYGEVMSGPVP